jgi:peptidoglycan/LPS O-acetylase OafA/YrhL
MAQILFEKQMALPEFFRRRFSRIYPTLLALVVALCALTFIAANVGIDKGVDPLTVATALSFTINYVEAFGGALSGSLEHIWSIAVEKHCYLLLAIIALVTARSHQPAIAMCILIAALAMANGVRLYAQGAGGIHEIYWRTDVRLAPVFLSAGLFLLVRRLPSPSPWLPAICLMVSLPAYLLLEPLPLKFIVPAILLAFGVNTIDVAHAAVRSALSSRLLVLIGTISYSLYLWQQPFYKFTDGHPLAVVPVFIVAIGSYLLIETPARRWINGLTSGHGLPPKLARPSQTVG